MSASNPSPAGDREGSPGGTRSGTVACVGRPNVGKSTLVNRLLGQKLVIVSPKPHTSSRRLRGIVNAPQGQFVVVDTPGIHAGGRAVNARMVREARRGIEGADAVLAVTDPGADGEHEAERLVLEAVRSSGLPAVLALNKVDLLASGAVPGLLERQLATGAYVAAVGVAARDGRNLDALLREIWGVLPAGDPVHPDDILSDQPERDFFPEMIREHIFRTLREELPYSAAVVVDAVSERERPHRYRVHATIYVERNSQKGILIGAGGRGLRRIGEGARREMERLCGAPVHLELWVKVRRNWTKDPRSLREFGFHGT